jgi:hypothetical protein
MLTAFFWPKTAAPQLKLVAESDREWIRQRQHVDWSLDGVNGLFKSTEALEDLSFIASVVLLNVTSPSCSVAPETSEGSDELQ